MRHPVPAAFQPDVATRSFWFQSLQMFPYCVGHRATPARALNLLLLRGLRRLEQLRPDIAGRVADLDPVPVVALHLAGHRHDRTPRWEW
jgi:hypothetical protein